MKKQTIHYSSPLDALVAITRRLSQYEIQHRMESEAFYDDYSKGKLGDDDIYISWANDYQHYLALHRELEDMLTHAA